MNLVGVAAAGAAVVLGCATAGPAGAADSLLFSNDGQTWSAALDHSVFGTSVLVPGDQVSGSFWVRNASTDHADFTVSVIGSDLNPGPAPRSLWITAAADPATPRDTAGQGEVVLRVPGMDAEPRKITITVGLGKDAPNALQEQSVAVAFNLRMSQSTPTRPDRPGGGPHLPAGSSGGADLADTGLPGLWPVLPALALVTGGTLAIVQARSKKKPRREDHGAP